LFGFNLFVAIGWYAFLALMAYLFQRQTKWLTQFSIFTPFLIALFMRYGVAIPFSNDVNATNTHYPVSESVLASYYLATAFTYIAVLVGVSSVGVVLRRYGTAIVAARTEPRALAGAFTIVLIVVWVAWIILPWQQFVHAYSQLFAPLHSAVDYRSYRIDYGQSTNFSASVVNYAGAVARFGLLPAITWILWFHRRHRAAMFGFVLAFGTLIVIGVLSGKKMPALVTVAGLLVAWQLGRRYRGQWLSVRLALAVIALVAIVVPTLYGLQYPLLSYGDRLTLGLFRLTSEYSRVGQLRFALYPDVHEFLYGRGSFVIGTLLSVINPTAPSQLPPETYIPLALLGPGYGGAWDSAFYTEAWADAGWVGVIAVGLMVGAYLEAVDQWFRRRRNSPIALGLYTALCLSVLSLTDVSLTTALWTYGAGSGFIVYWLVRSYRSSSTRQAQHATESVSGFAA
jgi:hypothetical protein